MKRLLIPIMTLTLATGIIGGATFAYFSSSAVNENNTFVAGTLSINSNRDQGDSIDGPMFYTTLAEGRTYVDGFDPIVPPDGPGPTGYWAPGDTYHRVLQIENTGSLNGLLNTVRANLEEGSTEFADIMDVKITTDVDGTQVVAEGKLGDFIAGDKNFVAPITCDIEQVVDLHFWVTLPDTAGDEYQGKYMKVGFTINAVQKDINL